MVSIVKFSALVYIKRTTVSVLFELLFHTFNQMMMENQADSVSYTSDRIAESEICSDMSWCFQSSPRLLSRASTFGSEPLNLTYWAIVSLLPFERTFFLNEAASSLLNRSDSLNA